MHAQPAQPRETRLPTTTTPSVAPDRSPPDVTAAVVSITDQARVEIRRVALRVTAAVLVTVVIVGAALAWQIERVRDSILTGR